MHDWVLMFVPGSRCSFYSAEWMLLVSFTMVITVFRFSLLIIIARSRHLMTGCRCSAFSYSNISKNAKKIFGKLSENEVVLHGADISLI